MLTTDTNKPRWTFVFKVLKTGLRVVHTDENDTGEITLSMPMWNALEEACASPKVHYGHHSFSYDDQIDAKRSRGLVTARAYSVPATDNWGRPLPGRQSATHTDDCAVSDLGLAIAAAMPKCPARDSWPTPKAKAPVSRDNIRVTEHQKGLLLEIIKGRVAAYPLAGEEKEVEKIYSPFGEGCWPLTTAQIRKMLAMELVEIGVDEPGLRLVVRATVHGALLAAEDTHK